MPKVVINAFNSILFIAPAPLGTRAVQLLHGRISGSLPDIIARLSAWNITGWRLTVLKKRGWRDEVRHTVLQPESHNWNKPIQGRTEGRHTCENIRTLRNPLQAVGGILSCNVQDLRTAVVESSCPASLTSCSSSELKCCC